jgi:CheY-like chemotaxis protein
MTDHGTDEAPVARILVIDDEELVRATLSAMLEESGYEVIEAGDGREALRLLRMASLRGSDEEGGMPGVVITDMNMPERDGTQIIVDLRRLHPELRIIAISGSGRDLLNMATTLGADRILQKPFELEQLLETVRSVLGDEA